MVRKIMVWTPLCGGVYFYIVALSAMWDKPWMIFVGMALLYGCVRLSCAMADMADDFAL
jgi:hypothetical protein